MTTTRQLRTAAILHPKYASQLRECAQVLEDGDISTAQELRNLVGAWTRGSRLLGLIRQETEDGA